MHKHLPHAANFIPVSKLETLGNIIPGVSIKNTKGSSETLILVSRALVTPGLLPTRSGFPATKLWWITHFLSVFTFSLYKIPLILRLPLLMMLISEDLPTFGTPITRTFESGANCLWNRSLFDRRSIAVGKTYIRNSLLTIRFELFKPEWKRNSGNSRPRVPLIKFL